MHKSKCTHESGIFKSAKGDVFGIKKVQLLYANGENVGIKLFRDTVIPDKNVDMMLFLQKKRYFNIAIA